ncbi:ISAs1 family transposase, partial [bacterium AH-315-G05]|nr:ISAs1 family transposase [bacterium AH-315-G05]
MDFHNKAYNRFKKTFKEVDDFRQEGKIKHPLIEILFIAVVATIAGADGWIAIGTFAESKEEWLRQYIPLDNGVPSHDTFERVFENIDVVSFNRTFINWTERLSKKTKDRIIAVDGKTLRRSHDGERSAIHIVNAWVDENDMILGQLKTEEKSNEITAIPELLEMLFLKGSIVTIDAMGTQKKIVEKIIEKKGDYVLALKGNHQTFSDEVKLYFEDAIKNNFEGIEVSKKRTLEKGHGRIEKREYFQTNDIGWFEEKHLWAKLTSIGMVRRTITKKEKTTVEVSYFISSLDAPKEEKCEL